jgi:hypothetical protein
MALTQTANLTTITSADTASDGGTWLGNSGAADTEVKLQGAGSYTWMAVKNGRTSCTFTPTTNLDMSGTGVHLYWWAMSAVAAFIEPFTEVADDPGYTLRLTDGSSNYKEWRIAGSDTWGGEWKCFVLDVNSTTDVYASSGSLSLSDIDVITWSIDMSNSGNIRIIDNQWNDVVRFGTGLKATGTDFDLTDMVDDDESSANKYGILENKDGVIFSQGKIQIGDGATTTTFNSTDEALIFKDRNSDGEGQVASGFYELKFTGSGLTVDIDGLVCKGAGTTDTTRYIVDADDSDITLDIAGSTFIRASTVGFAASDSITTSVFNNCGQIDPSTATYQNNTLSNTTNSGGALLLDSTSNNVSDSTFISDGTGHGVYITASGTYTFDNLQFISYGSTGTDNAAIYNNSGGAVVVNATNGSSGLTYKNGSGASTTVNDAKEFKFTLSPSITGYEWRIYEVTALGSLSGAVEKDGEESASADNQTYSYNYTTDKYIGVQIIGHANDYEESITFYILSNANQYPTILLTKDDNN